VVSEIAPIADRLAHWNNRPLFAWAGIEIIEALDGVSRVELKVEDHHRGGGGTEAVNGAICAYVLDCALGVACASSWDDGVQAQVTVTIDVHYLRMLQTESTLTGTGRVVQRGRTLVFVHGELLDESGEICATCMATYRLFRAR
jgi:uncharacterized protein (TIGR00369 family)